MTAHASWPLHYPQPDDQEDDEEDDPEKTQPMIPIFWKPPLPKEYPMAHKNGTTTARKDNMATTTPVEPTPPEPDAAAEDTTEDTEPAALNAELADEAARDIAAEETKAASNPLKQKVNRRKPGDTTAKADTPPKRKVNRRKLAEPRHEPETPSVVPPVTDQEETREFTPIPDPPGIAEYHFHVAQAKWFLEQAGKRDRDGELMRVRNYLGAGKIHAELAHAAATVANVQMFQMMADDYDAVQAQGPRKQGV
jgi:hypothetical protein